MTTGKRTGVTLAELIIIVSIVAALAVIAVPRLQFAAVYHKQAEATARKIVTDLRRTRRLAISNAATNTDGFKLKMSELAPYTEYHIENESTKQTVDSHTIDSAVTCTGGGEFLFRPLGNLSDASDTELIVSASGKTYTITVVRATGAIKCVQQ
jgi:Tfp pilus assembly protein PilE